MIFRKATEKDVLEIVKMMADDRLGKKWWNGQLVEQRNTTLIYCS